MKFDCHLTLDPTPDPTFCFVLRCEKQHCIYLAGMCNNDEHYVHMEEIPTYVIQNHSSGWQNMC